MKTRNSVLAKLNGCLVLIKVTPGGTGKCPSCGEQEFQESGWSGPEWIECVNNNCDFEILKSHVTEIENILASVSKTDCRP